MSTALVPVLFNPLDLQRVINSFLLHLDNCEWSTEPEFGLGETGLGETGLSETGLGETGLSETGLGETGLGETGLGETGLRVLLPSHNTRRSFLFNLY